MTNAANGGNGAEKALGPSEVPGESNFRQSIAAGITIVSIVAVVILGTVSIMTPTDSNDKATRILATVLPVIGTWVGTVLAYYFGRENFEAATRSAVAIANISPRQLLQSKPASSVMIPRSQMFFVRGPAKDVNLATTLDALTKAGKGDRIPVLDAGDQPLSVVHRSTMDKYIAEQARSTKPPDIAKMTLQDMLDDPDIKNALDTSFGIISNGATLADAKDTMDALPMCQDVFVTKAGTKAEPVIGWITNNIIASNAKV